MSQFEKELREFKGTLLKVHESYKELSKAVGGFNKEQADQILNICVKNSLLNQGVKKREIESLKMTYS